MGYIPWLEAGIKKFERYAALLCVGISQITLPGAVICVKLKPIFFWFGSEIWFSIKRGFITRAGYGFIKGA